MKLTSKDINGNKYEVVVADLVWRPSAYGIVIREQKILLVKENGKFHLPGGGVDLGEDPIDAVVRELKEETGVAVANPKLINAASSFFAWKQLDNENDISHAQSLLLYYSCDYKDTNESDIKLDDYEKAAGLKPEWVDISELDNIIVGTTVDWRPVVKQYSDI